MKREFYERLSALDEAFLAFETPSTYMHIALLSVFDGKTAAKRDGGVRIGAIRSYVASRLRFVPRYRQRLEYVPLLNHLVWVDDDHFDLGYHVRHASLPHPGTERQLKQVCATILERPLDRSRPLWEMWIIEGLPGGRFAMLTKVHHCMVDGIAGVDLLAALLTPEPSARVEKGERWLARATPEPATLLRREISWRVRALGEAFLGLGRTLGSPQGKPLDVGQRAAALFRLVRSGLRRPPEMPFNGPLGPNRRVEWLSFELSAVKAAKSRFECSVNDVVLATVAGAVRRYLLRKEVEIPDELRTLIPVNVRAVDEKGQLGNRVSIWVVSLPIHGADARERVRDIRRQTAVMKEANEASGTEVLTQAAEWTIGNVVNAAARLLNRTRFMNLIVTNVPGPPSALYMLDSPMLAAYPFVPLFESQGLGIALFSYAGTLHWGIAADWNLVPDLAAFAGDVMSAFAELGSTADMGKRRALVRRGSAGTSPATTAAVEIAPRPRAAAAGAAGRP